MATVVINTGIASVQKSERFENQDKRFLALHGYLRPNASLVYSKVDGASSSSAGGPTTTPRVVSLILFMKV